MIIRETVEKDIYGRGPVEDVQYFGKMLKNFLNLLNGIKALIT